MESNTIDIEKIMNEIREEIKTRGLSDDALEFSSGESPTYLSNNFNLNNLENQLHFANLNADIFQFHKIEGNLLVRIVKRIIRKCTRFYVQPFIDAQNAYNANSVRALNELLLFVKMQQQKEQEQNILIEKLITEINSSKKQ